MTEQAPHSTSSATKARPSRGVAIAIGIVAGALSGLFGVGGGILIVPALVMFGHMEQRLAHGTSLVAAAPLGLAGTIGYALGRSVDWAVVGLLLAGSAAGAVVGTRLLRRLAHRTLRLGFAALLILTAARLLIDIPEAAGRAPLQPGMAAVLIVIGLATGILAGLMGVGGGIIMVPAQNIFFDVPGAIARGTSLAVIVPTAIVGSIQNIRHHNADIATGVSVGLAGMITSFLLSQVAIGMDENLSAVLFAAFLLVSAARLVMTNRRHGPSTASSGG